MAQAPVQFTLSQHQEALVDYVGEGLTNNQIVEHFQDDMNVKTSLAAVKRACAKLNLRKRLTDSQLDNYDNLIRSYHGTGIRIRRILHALQEDHAYPYSLRALEKRISYLGLHRAKDDLILGKVSMVELVRHVQEEQETTEGHTAGYRRLTQLLLRRRGIHVHMRTVGIINKEVDPQGVLARQKHVYKRRVFRADGPNDVWSADGHDKLKKFGITMYGMIDTWSRRILGLWVHVTNNDPRRVGLYYLQLVRQLGGIPRKTTTDCGTETIDLAGHQLNITQQFTRMFGPDVDRAHRYVKSTANQKIECLWSQMMRQHNRRLIEEVFEAMEREQYDDSDPLQKLLFLYLWVPLVQQSCDRWVGNYNSYQKRYDKSSSLPTGCSPDWAYRFPGAEGGVDCLISVPEADVEELAMAHYPDAEQLLLTSPVWFSSLVSSFATILSLNLDDLTTVTVWPVFDELLHAIREADATMLAEGTPPSRTVAFRACEEFHAHLRVVV